MESSLNVALKQGFTYKWINEAGILFKYIKKRIFFLFLLASTQAFFSPITQFFPITIIVELQLEIVECQWKKQ